MIKHLAPGALLALSLFANAPAYAFSGSSHATLGDFKLELIDLAPDDGIAPALQFTNNDWKVYLAADDIEDFTVAGAWSRDAPYGNTSIVLNEGLVGASTHYDSGPPGSGYYLNGLATRTANFTLTPYTALRFTANADLHVDEEEAEAKVASFTARLKLTQPGDPLSKTSTLQRNYSLYDDGDKHFDLNFYMESGSRTAQGELYLSAWSTLQGVSAVPEPATYGMFLLGAAVLGAAARRRR